MQKIIKINCVYDYYESYTTLKSTKNVLLKNNAFFIFNNYNKLAEDMVDFMVGGM